MKIKSIKQKYNLYEDGVEFSHRAQEDNLRFKLRISDCGKYVYPIYNFDPKTQVVGNVHAVWEINRVEKFVIVQSWRKHKDKIM